MEGCFRYLLLANSNVLTSVLLIFDREKRQSRNSAIKVLDYAMTGPEGADLCQKFVDILGLRTIFPIFMKTPKVGDAWCIFCHLQAVKQDFSVIGVLLC